MLLPKNCERYAVETPEIVESTAVLANECNVMIKMPMIAKLQKRWEKGKN